MIQMILSDIVMVEPCFVQDRRHFYVTLCASRGIKSGVHYLATVHFFLGWLPVCTNIYHNVSDKLKENYSLIGAYICEVVVL